MLGAIQWGKGKWEFLPRFVIAGAVASRGMFHLRHASDVVPTGLLLSAQMVQPLPSMLFSVHCRNPEAKGKCPPPPEPTSPVTRPAPALLRPLYVQWGGDTSPYSTTVNLPADP